MEGSEHVAAGPAGGFGDIAAAGQVQGADGEVAQASHDAGARAGAGAGVVFAVASEARTTARSSPRPPLSRPAARAWTRTLPGPVEATALGNVLGIFGLHGYNIGVGTPGTVLASAA